MKQYPLSRRRDPESGRADCPVKCPVCRHDKGVYPARFNRTVLEQNSPLEEMENDSHRILFLLEGTLAIRTPTDVVCRVESGHCIFLARGNGAMVYAETESTLVWLDFSNRMTLCRQDCLDSISVRETSPAGPLPVLPTDAVVSQLVDNIPVIESPCYHMLKEYDLFMVMRNRYTEEQLGLFFHEALRPARDMKAFVLSNYRDVQSVGDFAWRANLSESTFIRRFREVFGMSVHQWMMKQKERDLCEMIANGERDTNKLAEGIGFVSQAGLYQFCRRRFGCSVSEIIERCGR